MALKLKSNNNQGNPYHDEEGKFTSKGGEGKKGKSGDPLMDLFGSLGKSMRDSEAEEKKAMKLFGLNEKENKSEPEMKEQLYPDGDESEIDEDVSEEQEASNLLGVDLSEKKSWDIDRTDPEMDEFLKLDYKGRQLAKKEGRLPKQFEKLDDQTVRSLMAGYNESVTDAPSHFESDELDIDYGEEPDISSDDLIEFLKYHDIKFSQEDEQLIRDNHVIPTRLLKETFSDDYSEKDLEEDLLDFKGR